jgi:hypothetical protein
MDSQPTDKVEGLGDDFVRGGRDKTPIKQKRNSYERTVVKAYTPAVTVTEGNGQYYAPWIVESPGGKVATSAYKDGKKRCLSVEGGLALEKRKGLAENSAARRAATGQAGKDKHAAGEAKRWAATGQADKDKHAAV